MVEIIKKYWCNLWFDISSFDENVLEDDFMNKLDDFVPYISTVYLSDKTKSGKSHVLPGDGILKLPTLLKKMKKNNYGRYFSLKVNIEKHDLADLDKIELILKKSVKYFQENYTEVENK